MPLPSHTVDVVPRPPTRRLAHWVVPALIGLFALVWVLKGLDHGMLWQDEAQTALLSKTVLTHGVPVGFDGRNFLSQELGAEYGPNYVWRWHTWLTFYLLAGTFKVFGISTFTARAPFAVVGAALVVLAYVAAKAMWRDRRAAVASAALVLACVPVLLLFRQCRYYSLSMFFSLLAMHAYVLMGQGRRRAWVLLTVAMILLFQTFYIYAVTLGATLAVHALIWRRQLWRPLVLSAVLVGVVCGPWAVWLSHIKYAQRYPRSLLDVGQIYDQAYEYVRLMLTTNFPYVLCLVGVDWVARRYQRAGADGFRGRNRWARCVPSSDTCATVALPVLFTAANIGVLSLTSPTVYNRYLAPAMVPMLLVGGRLVVLAFEFSTVFATVLSVSLALWWPVRSYVYELTHPIVGPVEGIVSFLHDHARPDDAVVTTSDDLPIKFYTGLRVIGGLTGEDISGIPAARWIIRRHQLTSELEEEVRRFLLFKVDLNAYRKYIVDAPDTKFENREDVADHRFSTAGKNVDRVVIYERPTDPPTAERR